MVDVYEQLSDERKTLQKQGKLPDWFTTGGWQMFKGYLYQSETWYEQIARIAKTAAKYAPPFPEKNSEIHKTVKYYGETWEECFNNIINYGHMTTATPTLANTGTNRGFSISCAGNYIGDSVDSFYSALHENALLSKHGFGTSSYLGDIRAHGTPISTGGCASGLLPVFEDNVQMAKNISQGGVRRGAWAGWIPIDHADFYEIFNLVLKNPENRNVGWCISDEFIARLKNGDKDAIDRFQSTLFLKMKRGKGYIMKTDTANKHTTPSVKNSGISIKASNLCVAPETKILTKEGYVAISVLKGRSVDVWNGKEWSKVVIEKTGENQPLMVVSTSVGELECTHYHKFYIDVDGKIEQVEAQDLKKGMKLISFDLPEIESDKSERAKIWYDVEFVPDMTFTKAARRHWFAHLAISKGVVIDGVLKIRGNNGYLQRVLEMLQTIGVFAEIRDGGLELDYNGTEYFHYFKTCENKNPVVLAVSDRGRKADTYCFKEEKRGMGMFNGMLTGQCSEIMLPSDEEHTFTCVLASLNLKWWDIIKNTGAAFVATVFLDCIVSDFIEKAKGVKGLEKAVHFTEKFRALGLGVMGWHTYLQEHMIPFASFEAHMKNNEIFSHIAEESFEASKWLAKVKGCPETCEEEGVRNATRTAIAPTMSTSVIFGQVSPGIDPIFGNVFVQPVSCGELRRINPVFLEWAKKLGKANTKTFTRIASNKGSVQDEKWLPEEVRDVLKTAFEIDQKAIVRLTSARQRWVDQGQSMNLYFAEDESEEYIAEIHKMILLDERIKSAYYVRTMAGVRAAKPTCEACD